MNAFHRRSLFGKATIVSLFIFLSFYASSQEFYYIKCERLNSDKTLRLEYIEQGDDNSTLYFIYTASNKSTAFTNLYLNNLRIIDRATGVAYYPSNTNGIPIVNDAEFFLYNYGGEMLLAVDFKRLPSYVKSIDVVEGTGTAGETYNFTFRDIKIGKENEDADFDELDLFDYAPAYKKSFYSRNNMIIDVYVDNNFVGKVDRYFYANHTMVCSEYGTFTVCFPNRDKRKLYATTTVNSRKYAWNFEFTPGEGMFSECSLMELKLN